MTGDREYSEREWLEGLRPEDRDPGPEQHAATVERLQSKLRSFIYGEWGSIGDERARALLAALDELVALAGRADELQRQLVTPNQWQEMLYRERRAAEARADELQRERDEKDTEAAEWYAKALAAQHDEEQARREADQLRAAVLYHVTRDGEWTPFESHEHRCEGKCPDEDDMDVRDPLCLACLSMDFPALAGVQAEEQT